MPESYPLRQVFATTDTKVIHIRFERALLVVDAPGPYNLKTWSVEVYGMDVDSTNYMDDCYYYNRKRVTLRMETDGGKLLDGETSIQSLVVGPHSRITFSGIGVLNGFKVL
ncbi:hypothetical protein GXN76_06060 [Kroppenstedtia pulmonis]|uniref:Uncharacterized protein n=1 Tax=Kroppenstedtia pulmonis TaxID=1380685 RepID=A0A7D3Y938_9BACL|nr:hypothetical protein [Kroppenstedtia pulmonis]QKG84081.1 hypothetical protein GXN76_06060 [Kroppenstedtia pulmonis]